MLSVFEEEVQLQLTIYTHRKENYDKEIRFKIHIANKCLALLAGLFYSLMTVLKRILQIKRREQRRRLKT